MTPYKAYIQQIHFDGTQYTKGSVVDILSKFNIACEEFPFKKNPAPKDLPKRDWAGAHGVDVYVPDVIPMKEYDIDVTFLYTGNELSIRNDISSFIDFIYGRIKGKNTDTVQCGRLAIYDEYVGMGRKDVTVSAVDPDMFDISECDSDAIARFKVKFTVNDPVTDVTQVKTGGVVTDLSF